MARATMLLAILMAPYALAWWLRARALHPRAAGAASSWFGFVQGIQWAAFANVAVWIAAWGSLGSPALHAWLQRTGLIAWSAPATILSFAIPIIAFQIYAGVVVQDVNRALRGAEISGAEVLAESLGSLARLGIVVLALCAAIVALALGQWRLGLGMALSGILAAGTLSLRPNRWPRFVPHAVTHGELRDRMFALAASAGVRLKQLYVVPLARTRVANALAVQGEKVVVTDYMLAHLSRDELDAVLAHELAHLRKRHPAWLAAALFGGATSMWIVYGWAGSAVAELVAFGGMIFGFMALSRRFEYAADAGAITLGARPEALVTGLARVYRLNHIPQCWSRWRELTLTHPSNERRARAIAARCGLPGDRLVSLLAVADAPPDRYELPVGAHEDRVFSTSFKAAALQRNGWLMIFANAVAAAAFALAASSIGLRGWARAFGFVPLAGLVFAATFATLQHLSMSPYRGLRSRLWRRHQAAGAEPDRGATWVGLAPNGGMRLYEGFATWDVGFLSLTDRMVYRGEETSFSLARDEITGVEFGPRFPSWAPVFGVVVRWRQHAGSEGCFTLLPIHARGLIAYAAESRRMRERLERWRAPDPLTVEPAAASHQPAPVPISAPPTVQVTSTAPHEALGHGAVLITLVIQLAVSAGVGAVAGLSAAPARGLGVLDVLLASSIAYVLLVLPLLRVRTESRSVVDPGARRVA